MPAHAAFSKCLALCVSHGSERLVAAQPVGREADACTIQPIGQEFFRDTQPVKSASDGTKAFTGIMAEIISGEKEVFFIDEPEAFLHPSLAGILGTEISRNLGRTSQLFVATHSPEFLLGCVASGKQIDVVRLTYDGSLGTAQLLHKDQLKKLFHDPLLRSADVVSGLFHGGAVVVEADNDRAFYGEIFHRLTSSEDVRARNVRFMNAQNKQTMPSISEFLRSMGVPAAMIFDLDWIKEDGEVCRKYLSGALIPQGLWDGFRNQRSAIRSTLEVANPDYKRAGGLRNLTGDDLASASAFLDTMEEYGIFTVRSGELESWLPQLAVGRNKNGWVPRIFEAMGSDPEDPNYIKPDADDVWNFIRRVNAWISRPDRKGM